MHYRFLIHISYAYGIPIGRPLVAEIERRGHEVRWFTDEPSSLPHFHPGDPVLKQPAEVVTYAPHIVLSASNLVPDFFPGLKVQVFHGFSVGKRSDDKGHFRIRGLFDLYCTQGPSTTLPFQRLAQQFRHFAVVETGWSKVDPLFTGEPRTASDKPCILVSSTFTPRLSLMHNAQVRETLATLMGSDQYRWMIVTHPKMDPAIVQALKALQNDHVVYHDTTDLAPIFRQADLMISDTTSVIPEFLLQRKPVVTFRNNQPGDYLINVTEASALAAAIDQALSRPTALMDNIDRYISQLHPYTDGGSSARIVDAAIQFLHADKSHLRRKPLNLYRKFKIRKQLGYFSLRSYLKAPTLPLPAPAEADASN